jgi:hypothetical protein
MISKLPTRPLGSSGLEQTGAIVGTRSAEPVDGWIGAGALKLTAADLETIAVTIERTGGGAGPRRPMQAHLAAAS